MRDNGIVMPTNHDNMVVFSPAVTLRSGFSLYVMPFFRARYRLLGVLCGLAILALLIWRSDFRGNNGSGSGSGFVPFAERTDAELMRVLESVATDQHRPEHQVTVNAVLDELQSRGDMQVLMRTQFLLGQTALRANHFRIAEDRLRRALLLDPNFHPARRELIYILGIQLRRKELSDMLEYLSEHDELSFHETWLWSMVPDLIWWEPNELLPTLETLLAADPDDRWSRLALAENLRRLGRYDRATQCLAPLPPNDPQALALRGLIALETNRPDEAVRLITSQDVPQPPTPELSQLRGKLALLSHQPAEALTHLQIAHDLWPQRRAAFFELAQAHQALGQTLSAARLQAVARIYDAIAAALYKIHESPSPNAENLPDLLLNLADYYESVPDPAKARAWFQLALARDPQNPKAQQGLFRLRTQK